MAVRTGGRAGLGGRLGVYGIRYADGSSSSGNSNKSNGISPHLISSHGMAGRYYYHPAVVLAHYIYIDISFYLLNK